MFFNVQGGREIGSSVGQRHICHVGPLGAQAPSSPRYGSRP